MQSTQKNSKKKIKLSFILAILSISIILILALTNYCNILTYNDILVSVGLREKPSANSEVSVHFIDVGQGDCILIQSGNISVLIDSGEKEYSSRVIAYLEAQNIEKLDYIIATHPHSDHIGGLSDIIEQFPVGKIYMSDIPKEITPTTAIYENLLKTVKENNLKISCPYFRETLDLGKSKLELFPPRKEYDNLNNCSIVSKLTCGDTTFLFTGDAEKEAEQDLIRSGADLNADVLKVGHHGSDTSSSDDFLKRVNPQFCIISCGADNSFNHPSKSTVARLNKFTQNVLRTDLFGTIIIETDGCNCKYYYKKGD